VGPNGHSASTPDGRMARRTIDWSGAAGQGKKIVSALKNVNKQMNMPRQYIRTLDCRWGSLWQAGSQRAHCHRRLAVELQSRCGRHPFDTLIINNRTQRQDTDTDTNIQTWLKIQVLQRHVTRVTHLFLQGRRTRRGPTGAHRLKGTRS
jgi:hypothetical protein